MTSPDSCSSLEGCIWRDKLCRDNTFVQCPGIDVVFLVEATPIMLKQFGPPPKRLLWHH